MTKKQIAAIAAATAALGLTYQTFMRYDYTTNPHNGVVMSRIDRLTGTVCPRSCLYPKAAPIPSVTPPGFNPNNFVPNSPKPTPFGVPTDFVPVTQPANRAR